MAPWKLPLLVAAIAVPIAAGFLVGGPGIGVGVGALVAVVVVVIAALAGPAEDHPEAEAVLVLAPARIGSLDRWASDLEDARRAAQENLVVRFVVSWDDRQGRGFGERGDAGTPSENAPPSAPLECFQRGYRHRPPTPPP